MYYFESSSSLCEDENKYFFPEFLELRIVIVVVGLSVEIWEKLWNYL